MLMCKEISCRIQAVYAPLAYLPTMVKDGRLKAIAISSNSDLREHFVTPTARSLGVDYITTTWYGLDAPSKAPPLIVEVLSKKRRQVSENPDEKSNFQMQGLNPYNFAPAAFDMSMMKDSERQTPLITSIVMN